MAAARYLNVAREGWPLVLLTAGVALAVQQFYSPLLALPVWVAAFLWLYLFRDPERAIPAVPLAVVSPTDGTVLSIQADHDPYLERDAVVVSLAMSPFGSYTTRAPIEGKIMRRWYSAAAPDAGGATGNGLWLQTDEGDDVVIMMRNAGSRLRQPRCDVQPGERIGHGKRCGFIPFGARVDLYLPAGSRVDVHPGDPVRAGSDVVAMLVHK
jgi:phosphatidylserine decarboxylase